MTDRLAAASADAEHRGHRHQNAQPCASRIRSSAWVRVRGHAICGMATVGARGLGRDPPAAPARPGSRRRRTARSRCARRPARPSVPARRAGRRASALSAAARSVVRPGATRRLVPCWHVAGWSVWVRRVDAGKRRGSSFLLQIVRIGDDERGACHEPHQLEVAGRRGNDGEPRAEFGEAWTTSLRARAHSPRVRPGSTLGRGQGQAQARRSDVPHKLDPLLRHASALRAAIASRVGTNSVGHAVGHCPVDLFRRLVPRAPAPPHVTDPHPQRRRDERPRQRGRAGAVDQYRIGPSSARSGSSRCMIRPVSTRLPAGPPPRRGCDGVWGSELAATRRHPASSRRPVWTITCSTSFARRARVHGRQTATSEDAPATETILMAGFTASSG